MKNIKWFFICNSIIYWSVYIIKTFLIWELENPFYWITQLPYDSELRLVVFALVLLDLVILGVISPLVRDKFELKE